MTVLPTDSSVATGAASRRVAVLGLGRVGLAYAMAAANLPGARLAGLADPQGALRRFARGAGFAVPFAPDLERLRSRTAIDAVVVALPPEERAAAIEAAVAAGIAVLVDGLPSPHAEGAARLEPVLAAAQAPVGCATGVLFHPLFARAARLLAAGAIGAPADVRASVYVSRVFSAGAPPARGDVLDFAVAEQLVLLDMLFGPVLSVAATAHRLYADRIDEIHARLALASGVEAGLDGSWSVPGYPRASLVVEVRGGRGSLLVSDDAIEAELDAPADGLPAGHSRRVFAQEPDPVPFDAGEPARALAAFLAGGAVLPGSLDVRRALRAARVVAALRRSAGANGARQEVGA